VLPPPPSSEAWAEYACHDSEVHDALAILGRDDVRWHDLYHVLEVVESDAGGAAHSFGWATKRELDLFARTANNRVAIGSEARHGHKRWTPPKEPMTLNNAKALIRHVVRKWIESKVPPLLAREVVVEIRNSPNQI